MRLSQVMVAAFEASCLFSNVLAVASTDSLMDGDSSQSGYLPNHNMDPAVIAGGSFGQIWSFTTPTGTSEQFYAKPLVFTPSSTGRQIVLSFSEQNRIYSLDAVNGTLYATRDLGLEGEAPFSVADLGSCNDISGSIGVTGTPVIDPTTDTVYFWAKSYLGTTKGYQNGAYRFHAIDAVTLKEKPGFPVNIQGVQADNDNTRFFTGGTVLQRPSLNLVNGVVFAGFGGHCDQYNFTGWVVGMSASSGKLLTSYVTSGGPGSPPQDGTFTGGGGGAGIWMSGSAIASDQAGRLFFSTGNAYKTEVNQNIPASGRLKLNTLSECVVNMAVDPATGIVTQQDYFEPYTYRAMDAADRDLGSGGVSLPDPGTFSGGGVSRLAITVGKNGVAYIMNADNLGGYKLGTGGTDAIIQTISMPGGGSVFGNAGTYPLEGGFLYITPVGYPTLVYSLGFTSAGVPAFTLVSQTPDVSAARVGTGPATITTYKGQSGTGILWIVDPDAGLRAYNAVPNGGVMTKINLPSSPSVSKFQRPAFGDGRYYVSTSNGKILAFGSPVALPLTCTSPVDFGSVPIGNTKTLNVTCVANIKITKLTGIILGKAVYTASNSSLPTGALAVGASFTFPVTFDLSTHQLNAGSTSSGSVAPGVQTTSISILTVNGVTGFAPAQPITLTGLSISSAPFLTINPLQVDFQGIVVGSAAAETGSDSTFIINNVGLNNMTILGMAFTNGSISSATSVFHNLTSAIVNGVPTSIFDSNGVFTSTNLPAVGTIIKGGGSVTISANFKSNVTGNFFTMLQVYTDGGSAYTVFTGSAATTPVALLEYSTGEGGWNTIPHCIDASNGCAYEIDFAPSGGLTSQTIQLRLTNNGGSALTITKSKPLEGTELGATNPSTDFSEGLAIVPGDSEIASVSFSPGASILNGDNVNYSGTWTLNTDDITFGVHSITFKGTVISTKTGPVTAQGNSLFKYLGCYQDYVNNVRLEPKQYINANNTNGLCQTQGQAYGAVFAGSEYMTECWVGSVIPPVSAFALDTFCSYQCAGDLTQACGGPNGYISIYYDSTRYFPANNTIIGASGASPARPATVGAFNYAGCYSDVSTARVLSAKTMAAATLSLESCATFCASYSYFGTEYSTECYCGNVLGSTSVIKPDNDCSMNCAGNTAEFCGAGSRLSLYVRNGTTIPSAAASSTVKTISSSSRSGSSTSSSATATPTPASKFNSLGCYSDNDVTQRTLIGGAFTDAAMTIELCATNCQGFALFGIEYSQECYCGPAISTSSELTTDGRCSMPCAGNAAEVCGGSYGMNIYSYIVTNTTSTTASTSSTSQSTSSSALSITSISSSSSIPSSTSSTTSAAPTPTVASIPPVIGVFTYQHCHSDNTTIRTLDGKYTANAAMTLENCAIACAGFTYFGVEYYSECRCGNTLSYGSFITTDGRCNMKCLGNTSEICGGNNGMTLYQNIPIVASNSSSTSSAAPTSSLSVTSSLSSSTTILTSSTRSTTLSSSTSVSLSSTSSSSSSIGSASVSSSFGTSSSSVASSSSIPYSSSTVITTSTSSSIQPTSTSSSTSTSLSSSSISLSFTSSSQLTASSLSSSVSSSTSSSKILLSSSSAISSSTSVTPTTSTQSTSSTTLISSTTSSSSTSSSTLLQTSSSTLSTTFSTTTPLSTSTSAPTTSSQSSSIIISSASSTSSTLPSTSASPWAYIGCANDTITARALTGGATTNTTAMTPEYCQAYCISKNFNLAGIEYGSECYCGSSLAHNSVLGQTGCSMACPGSKSSTCGGSSRLSVYNLTTFVPPTIPTSIVVPPTTWNYTGCYAELTNARALVGYTVTNATAMTVDMCVSTCSGKGYSIAGVQYGSQCFCSNTLSPIAVSAGPVADAQCQVMLCPGNKQQWCSAGSRLMIYQST